VYDCPSCVADLREEVLNVAAKQVEIGRATSPGRLTEGH